MMMKRALKKDVSVSELRELRAQGMSNKQIAESLDISVSTVYRYIGKKSFDPMFKDLPKIKEEVAIEPITKEEDTVIVPAPAPVPTPTEKPSSLKIVKEVRIIDLEGLITSYRIDQRTGDIEMGYDKNTSVVFGMLSTDTIDTFINELLEIKKLVKGE